MDTQEQLIGMLSSKFDMPEADLRSGRSFDDLGLDSLVLLEVALAISKETGVHLGEEELVPDLTVTHLADLLESKLLAA